MSAKLASWRKAWNELGAAATEDGLHQELVACWSETHRHYHTLQHLGECLARFEEVHDQAQRPGEVALALWFHDAIYEPARDDNEARSAEWARTSVLQAGLSASVADRVHALVMATRHDVPPQSADAQLLVDVDLAILGAPPQRFDEFDQQVRAEYAHVPDEQFRLGRRRILSGFLSRPRIYGTDYFHSRLDAPARENLERAVARLSV
jgi:predicted metal-dependent HD superfamily phosphohydrolase